MSPETVLTEINMFQSLSRCVVAIISRESGNFWAGSGGAGSRHGKESEGMAIQLTFQLK
jgi:hypothetical protein